MGRLSNERLEELIHASWRDLTESERRYAMREMRRRANNDSAVRIFAEDLLRANPDLSALEAWDKAKGLHETEQRAPTIYGKDAGEAANPSAETDSDGDSDGDSGVWLDEPPEDEYQGPNAWMMDFIAECRKHPGKWRRFGDYPTRKRAQTRAGSIRRSKAWQGFEVRAIDCGPHHETWVSYQGDAK